MGIYRNFVYVDSDGNVTGVTVINTLYEKENNTRYGLNEYNEVVNKTKYKTTFDVVQNVKVNDKEYITMLVGIQ